MGEHSKIEWTHHTFNPWWGCTRVSPGCERCYAETFAKRTGLGWGPRAERRLFGEKHWNEPLKWNRAAGQAKERRRVFCASMADVFEDRPELETERAKLWLLIAQTPWLDWLLLTKRPENASRMVPSPWADRWPANVWAMTTAEDQQRADERIPHLLRIPARVRGLSMEPLLGPVRLNGFLADHGWRQGLPGGINWVIVGGESGHGARPFDLRWARHLVSQCRTTEAAAFVKQLGAFVVGEPHDWEGHRVTGPESTGRGLETRMRIRLNDKKGGDPSEWPEDLRIRELPVSALQAEPGKEGA